MSLYPLAAISTSKMIQDYFSGENSGLQELIPRTYKTLAIYSTLLLVIGALLKVFQFPDIYDTFLADVYVTMTMIGIGGLIASLWFFKRRGSAFPVIVLVVTMLVVSIYTASCTMINLDRFKPMKAISQKINSQYLSNEVIIGYKVMNQGSFIYYLDKPVIWISNIIELREQLNRTEKILLITNERDFLGLGHDNRKSLFLVYKAGEMVLLSNQK
jgi:hypothetical protein